MLPFSPATLLSVGEVDFVEALRNNDTVGWICLIFLSITSIYSLTIIFFKLLIIWRIKKQTSEFQELVDADGSWETLYMAAKRYPESPIAKLLKETYVECRQENWFEFKKEMPFDNRLEIAKNTIEGILLRTISQEESRLQSNLSVLATISTLAPFIGLFGTVWGVLAAFQALGHADGATLTSLAPGISTALMVTVFGLIAAIPALVAYNYFTTEINKLGSSMESFAHEIENAVRKQILQQGVKTK
ncbi:MotA/TolQ/ExbB proton channel family protein [Candidatus Sumerlaeota bacterium]|nr:MotA/TolQ/ExbB proton channel family protein [Candidatus Sumerlaeota bacterium]